jgi:hypothetical protein
VANIRPTKTFLNREVFYKTGLVVFGLTLFPGIVFLIRNLFSATNPSLLTSYAGFYGSLLDFSVDGLISWSIACVPYFAYDVSLMISNNRIKKNGTG